MKNNRKTIVFVTLLVIEVMFGGLLPAFGNAKNNGSGLAGESATASVITNNVVISSIQQDGPPEGSTAYYELNIRDCFKKNDWEGGKAYLDQALMKYPQMSAFNELMGRYLLHQADAVRGKKSLDPIYDKARYYLIRAISIDEKNVQARLHMLQLETETRHYSSAIVYCNDLLEENPYNEDLWRKKIDLYRYLGNHDEADRLLERLYSIYPGDDQLRKDLIYSKEVRSRQLRNSGDIHGHEHELRQLIDLNSKNPDYHLALTNLLYSTGRIAEAVEAAGRGAAETRRQEFVEKRASMLCEMSRHREAIEYVKTFMGKNKGGSLAKLIQELEMEAARAAQYNDPYTSYAKIYESQHSKEALDYLVNTSIQRWYLDDAAMYIEEALRSNGNSPKLLYSQYLIQKRLGNTRKANSLLENLYTQFPDNEDIIEEMMLHLMDNAKELMDMEQYAEAAPILEQIYYSKAYPYIRDAAFLRLYSCYFQTKQYEKAEKMLTHIDGPKYIAQTAMLYNAWGKPKKALHFLAETYEKCEPTDTLTRNLVSYTYEEIAIPHIKNTLAMGRVNEAHDQILQAATVCPENIDILRYGITAAQRKGNTEDIKMYVTRGRQLYPNDPYFILKDAQIKHLSGNHLATLDQIKPLLNEYVGDTLLINLYVDSSIDIACDHLKAKQTDEAINVLEAAQNVAPNNYELYNLLGQAYEQKKQWSKALEYYKKYKPAYTEWAEYRHHTEELTHRTHKNTLTLEYQQARPGNQDNITSNAYVDYARNVNHRATIDVGIAYAGRDGATSDDDTEMTRGGSGIQLSSGWDWQVTKHFTAKLEAAAATRYFPIIKGRLTATCPLPADWQLTTHASYRLLRTYTGIYGWQSPITGYDNVTGTPITGTPEWVRKGWQETKKSMIQIGAGITKTLSIFNLGAEITGHYLAHKFYYNTNAKITIYPRQGNSSHLYAIAGIGTAPESTLIDRSLPLSYNKTNTHAGLGGSCFINRHITLRLGGTWYTILAQSEHLDNTYIVNEPLIKEDYRNYYYIHANLLISF